MLQTVKNTLIMSFCNKQSLDGMNSDMNYSYEKENNYMYFECFSSVRLVCVEPDPFLWVEQSIYNTAWLLRDLYVSLVVAHILPTVFHVPVFQ